MHGTSLSKVTDVAEEGGGKLPTATGMGDTPFFVGKAEVEVTLEDEGQACRRQTPTIHTGHKSLGTVIQQRCVHLGFVIAIRQEPALVGDHADSCIKTKEK